MLYTLLFRRTTVALLASVGLLGQAIGQGGPATVVVAPVIEREVTPTQSFVANVRPRRDSVIGSAVDGRVEHYLVNAGQAVKEGQELAQLRTRTIKIEVAAAEAELTLRRAELAELENGSRPEEIQLAEASARAAEAGMEYATAKLARAERLFLNKSGVSKDEYEAARAESITATERATEAKYSLKLMRDGPRTERIEQARARRDMQEQVVAGLRDRESKYTICAPFDGFVAAELSEAGAWVKQGDALAQVVEIDPVEVEVFVPESNVRFVRKGNRCVVQVSALGEKGFPGTIDQVVPLADNRSRTFPVRILVDNPGSESRHELMPGMLARAILPTGQASVRMLVPKDALQFGGPNPIVFKVDSDKAVLVPVRTGPSLESWIAVESLAPDALKPDDLVVTRGNERLRPGQDLVISERQSPPEFDSPPESDSSPESDSPPETSSAPETSSPPETSSAPETSSQAE
jgi:multidrug efflux pump subunit AcrA (membrane-fusion protein)